LGNSKQNLMRKGKKNMVFRPKSFNEPLKGEIYSFEDWTEVEP